MRSSSAMPRLTASCCAGLAGEIIRTVAPGVSAGGFRDLRFCWGRKSRVYTHWKTPRPEDRISGSCQELPADSRAKERVRRPRSPDAALKAAALRLNLD